MKFPETIYGLSDKIAGTGPVSEVTAMSVLQRLWKDTMDIYRWVEKVESGITKQK